MCAMIGKNMIQFTNQCGNGIELGIRLILMCKFTLVKSGWEAVHAVESHSPISYEYLVQKNVLCGYGPFKADVCLDI